jgi:MFS family permease
MSAAKLPTPASIQRTYLVLLLGNTLAASLIWGINTIFLLDAGLSNLEAFAANAFFTAGMVLFEVPTGVVADTAGRRLSYLLGTVTLAASTLLYVLLWRIHAPFWQWAVVSMLIGLGFTFFSGAVDAWLVDALKATGFTGELESVFGRAQVVTGTATLVGSVLGGLIAQRTSLGVPFLIRGLILVVMFVVAFRLMHDVGFSPEKAGSVLKEVRKITSASIEYGLRVPAVRWLMIESLFTGGVGIYGFYALQPYLLQLYGDRRAYVIAGLAAAIVAGAQILGGLAAPRIRRIFRRRTSTLITTATLSVVVLSLMGILQNFWVVIGLVVIWSLIFAASMPIRQTYMNGMIPSRQRATILSFDSMMGSAGGVWAQPLLGRVADVWGYGPSYVVGAAISAIALPALVLSRRQNAPADRVQAVGASSLSSDTRPRDRAQSK